MPAQWTADLIGEMHLARVSKKQLAERSDQTAASLNGVLRRSGSEEILHGSQWTQGAGRSRRAI